MKVSFPQLLLTILAGAALGTGVVLVLSQRDSRNPTPPPLVAETSSTVLTPSPTPEATQPAPTPVPAPTASAVRVQIDRIKVDAPIITLGVDSAGAMESPAKPTDVAWYTFSAKPGNVGNVVMSGHVDWANYGPAVFWYLRDLKPGDGVTVQTDDGLAYTYKVVSVIAYDEDTAPVAEIVGPTPVETLTLITCTGIFDRTAHDYDKRLVVRAERSFG